HGNEAAGSRPGIERNERRPAHEDDEEQEGDHGAGADLRARVARFAVHWGKSDGFAHAAFSAALGPGPVRRATTSAAGPIILGRPSSSTSSRSAAARTLRRWAMTITVASRARARVIAANKAASPF